LLYLAHKHASSLLFYSAKDTGLLKRVKQTASKFNKSEACLIMLCVALPGHQHAASLLFSSAKDVLLLKRVKKTSNELNKSVCLSMLCVALPGSSACCLPTLLLSQRHGTTKVGKADYK